MPPAESAAENTQKGFSVEQAAEAIANIPGFEETGEERTRREESQGRVDVEDTEEEDSQDVPESDDEDTAEAPVEDEDDEAEDNDDSAELDEDDETDEDSDEDSDEPLTRLTIDEIAEALGATTDEVLDALMIPIKVQGKEEEKTLRDTQTGFQLRSDYTKDKQALLEERTAFEAESQQAVQTYQQQHQVMAALFNNLRDMVLQQPDPHEMARLQQEDPTMWVQQNEMFRQRNEAWNQHLSRAAGDYETFTNAQKQEQQEQAKQFLDAQRAEIQKHVPGWGDDLRTKVHSFASERYGYTPEELQYMPDNRFLRMALDALKSVEIEKKSTKTREKVRKIPKGSKRKGVVGSGRTAKQKRADQLKSLRAKARASGDYKDAAKVIESMDI